MTAYAYHPNTSVMHASASIESVRPPTNDERRANWAAKYCVAGRHRRPQKPRIRIPVTVPEPLSNLPASPDACSRVRSGGAGRQSIPQPAVNDDAGWADYMRRAFAGDFEPF